MVKTFQDDVNHKSYGMDKAIKVQISFSAPDGKYFKAQGDISPNSLIDNLPMLARLPWGEYHRFSEEELKTIPEKFGKKPVGEYRPAKNVMSILATMREEETAVKA